MLIRGSKIIVGVWKEVPGGGTTDGALAAESDGSNLYIFLKGMNNRVYYNVMKPNEIWSK